MNLLDGSLEGKGIGSCHCKPIHNHHCYLNHHNHHHGNHVTNQLPIHKEKDMKSLEKSVQYLRDDLSSDPGELSASDSENDLTTQATSMHSEFANMFEKLIKKHIKKGGEIS